MKSLAPLLIALAAACSDAQAGNPPRSSGGSPQLATPAQPTIALAGRVTDAANVLDAAQEASLSQRLEQLEHETRRQMVIVTVPTLGGRAIDAFTRDLGNAWGIGRADYDDGLILLIAPHERQVRIAVGYGLEKVLPDALCKKIIDEKMLPPFREGDLPRGIEAGARALIDRLAALGPASVSTHM